MNRLTAIIAFRNEGNEVERTIEEIKRTAGDTVEILLINDASEDGYDYRGLEWRFPCVEYIENETRTGCAASREIGVKACRTPYFFIIDGHMRFYNDNWWIRLVEEIEADPRAVYCCRCRVWDFETKQERDVPAPYGAFISLSDPNGANFFDVSWITKDIFPEGARTVEIPCVLGACYAASKEYWTRIRGLEGLRLYSGDEAYVSMKAWMEGGKCKLLKDVAVGHLFREQFPYKVARDEFVYNRLLMARVLLPGEIKEKVWRKVRLDVGCVEFAKMKRLFDINKASVDELQNYYSTTLKMNLERFIKINDGIIGKLNDEQP